jgi:uncharacterized protein YgiM (DUF1202 family)
MKTLFLFILMTAASSDIFAQLKLGSAKSEINLREGPGLNYKVTYTVGSSNLLVVLPREPKNNFLEVFDIETNSYGFVSEKLIVITDTLNFQKQHFFERSGENETGDVEIDMINQTSETLYIWINGNTYNLFPFEKKILMMNVEEITFFSSAPGLFPVFGREILKKGNAYRWNFSL